MLITHTWKEFWRVTNGMLIFVLSGSQNYMLFYLFFSLIFFQWLFVNLLFCLFLFPLISQLIIFHLFLNSYFKKLLYLKKYFLFMNVLKSSWERTNVYYLFSDYLYKKKGCNWEERRITRLAILFFSANILSFYFFKKPTQYFN